MVDDLQSIIRHLKPLYISITRLMKGRKYAFLLSLPDTIYTVITSSVIYFKNGCLAQSFFSALTLPC